MFVRRGPLWFRIVAVALVAWGLMGVIAWAQQMRPGADAMGPATAYDRALFARLPGWYAVVYLVATGAGLAGAMLLVLRKATARPFFAASLAAIVVQFGWLFAATDIVTVKGAGTVLPFPLLIAAIAVFAIWLAGHATARGWIRRGRLR